MIHSNDNKHCYDKMTLMPNRQILVAFLCGLVLPGLLFVSTEADAQTEIERLQSEIDERNSRLTDIDAEILRYQRELEDVGAERQTLQSAIAQLETERKKINAEISKTDALITSTDLEISKLILEISQAESDIAIAEDTIGELIRSQYRESHQSLLEIMLQHDRLSDFMRDVEAMEQVNSDMAVHVASLNQLKTLLEERREQNESKRSELANLNDQYQEQNQVLVNNKAEQNELLVATKNEEAAFQELLVAQEAAREQLLQEMREFESQLQFILDPNSIPVPGTAVFNWPVTNPYITQFFGGTEFAKRNPGIYGGRPYHPGVDFGAPRGTPILAPLTGTVRAIGNTDAVPGCYSWGKWTLIDHVNGLSTLYAHQDVFAVTPGQKVETGQVIGYIGNTGISTGPHLHFTVYAQEAVTVRKFNEIKTVTGCGPATTPVAATDAYLDPMDYLPPY